MIKLRKCVLLIAELIVLGGMLISYPTQDTGRFILNVSTVIRVIVSLILLNIAIFFCKRQLNEKWMIFFNLKVASIYSVILVLGRAYIARGNLTLVWQSSQTFCLCFLSWFAFTIVLYSLFIIVYNLTSNHQLNCNVLDKKRKDRYFLIIFSLFIVLSLLYFISALPGIVSFDGMYQIDELFHEKTVGGQYSLTNHNPIFSTLVQGFFIKIGISIFHSINVGILLNTIFLNLLMITGMSLLVTIVAIYLNKYVSFFLAAFLGLFPVFFLWANTLDKTGYFIAVFLYFVSSLIILDKENEDLKSIALLVVSGLVLGLLRNDGMVYLIAALLGSLTLKSRKKVVLSIILSCILVVGLSKAMMYVTRALPTEPMESLSIPMQQLGRVVKYNPRSITSENKKNLKQFFNYKQIAKSYNPEYADKMKGIAVWPYLQFKGNYQQRLHLYNEQPFQKNRHSFWKVWWQVGKRNKKLYFESLVGMNIFYLYPQNHQTIFSWVIGPNFGNSVQTELFSSYGLWNERYLAKLLRVLSKVTLLPLVKYLFISFTWFLLWLLPSVSVINQEKYKYLNLIFIGGAIITVSLMSPVNGLMRYTFPLIILDPILWIVCMNSNMSVADRGKRND